MEERRVEDPFLHFELKANFTSTHMHTFGNLAHPTRLNQFPLQPRLPTARDRGKDSSEITTARVSLYKQASLHLGNPNGGQFSLNRNLKALTSAFSALKRLEHGCQIF